MSKICGKCEQLLISTEFHKNKDRRDGLDNRCKVCKKIHNVEYYKLYKAKIQKNHLEWKNRNPEYSKQYYQINKDRINCYYKVYNKKRKQEDLNFKISSCLRSRLTTAIKNSIKKGSHVKDLGCTIDFLKNYLESRFYLNPNTGIHMTWKNHGKGYNKWQIDHMIELQNVDLTNLEDFKKVVHYKNLQPLWYCDHVEKGRRVSSLS